MKAKTLGAVAVLAAVSATLLPAPGPCVMRANGTPRELCLRNGRQVRFHEPFPASEGTPECRPAACGSIARSVLDSSERAPTGYDPRTGDIFSTADGGHE